MKNNSTVKVTLTRDLRLFDVTMIGVGAMIGAGIFVLTGLAAGQAGPALLLAFFLNGIIALFTAASYAELGAAMPEAGGGYAWVREGLSTYFGFLSGWMSWFAQAIACSLYSLGFGSFAARLLILAGIAPFGLSEATLGLALAVFAAAIFTYINFRGAAETGRVGSILTLAKVVILLILILFGLKALANRPHWPQEFLPVAWYTTLIWIALGTLFYVVYSARAPAMAEPVRIVHEEIVAVADHSVLIPVANTTQARLLGILASAVAQDRGGEVFALHVVRVPRQLGITDGRYFLKQGKPILETVIDEAQQRDVPVHTMIRLGRTIPAAILETARERATDLMFLSWPGYT